ncbi:TraR/DksA family transcriptional regulator [Metabacillus sp. RGM 3146]|uniref:TraR/DksA family transcriptional regulator n=1 Tax=Metabacillus sp. RGM 3146 TaxID=3401092 RepID=UPI003B9DA28E
MDDHYEAIRYELELMREELKTRLFELCCFESPSLDPGKHFCRKSDLLFHIKEELYDVEYSLSRIEAGTYGFCELTGTPISFEKLRILPTARTLQDFSYKEQYEKKSLPYMYSPVSSSPEINLP